MLLVIIKETRVRRPQHQMWDDKSMTKQAAGFLLAEIPTTGDLGFDHDSSTNLEDSRNECGHCSCGDGSSTQDLHTFEIVSRA